MQELELKDMKIVDLCKNIEEDAATRSVANKDVKQIADTLIELSRARSTNMSLLTDLRDEVVYYDSATMHVMDLMSSRDRYNDAEKTRLVQCLRKLRLYRRSAKDTLAVLDSLPSGWEIDAVLNSLSERTYSPRSLVEFYNSFVTRKEGA